MRRNAASAVMMAMLAVYPAVGAAAPHEKPAVAPAVFQFDQATAAYDRGDYATAYRLFRPLAEQGYVAAQTNLGILYYTGQGVTQDYAAAVSWYRKAADQGNAGAQFSLGYMYANGQGVTQDYAAAVSWYRKAADLADAHGQFNLGLMYAKGQGVAQDYVQAHKWFNLGAVSGNADAVKSRDVVAALMTPAQIAEAQRLASAWKPTK